jgi:helicase MOV-10
MPRLLREDNADAILMSGNEQMTNMRAGTSDADALKGYCRHQTNLLYAEEVQLNRDLSMFDFVDDKATVLQKRGALLWLKVPGLAENRPSVLKGDKVRAKLFGTKDRLYEGKAVEIHEEEVGLLFSPRFADSYSKQRIEIHFVLGRRPIRLFHQGVDEVRGIRASLIFPEPADIAKAAGLARMTMTKVPWNENLNEAQLCAVDAIVKGTHHNVPYVIFGPPGTGKTTTLVEAVLQCAKQGNTGANSFKILVCAPTNTAADFIASKLAKVHTKPSQLLRVVAYSRSRRDVPADLVENNLTNFNWEEGTFDSPTLQAICKPLVVVATLTKAAGFMNDGVPRGHFDMIMIDEAGQAIEQEAIAAAACLLSEKGQLVVAGDPNQLGPVVHHDLAKEHGLATSYLERLMTRSIYRKQPAMIGAAVTVKRYNENVLTKLVENYRSHSTLLQLPNELFYENELIAKVNPVQGGSCCHWEHLPRKEFPLMWTGIQGKDAREANSPSWFNADEALQVVRHVKDLLDMKSSKITPEQIGIISPYNKQVHKIRKLLKYEGIDNIKVGSTEMFQGQERRVIIISTVRSCPDYISFDKQHTLGFLDNPKRFNVATTRAQALLIVVGNPIVLASDPCWRALLQLCVKNGAYRGEALPSDLFGDQEKSGGGGSSAGAGTGAGVGSAVSDNDVDALGANIEALLLDETDGVSHQMEEGSMEMPSHE